MVDRELRVLAWNDQAEAFWKLSDDEVRGRSFLDLDLGLPTGRMASLLQAALAQPGGTPPSQTIAATNRDGTDLMLCVTANDLVGADGDLPGCHPHAGGEFTGGGRGMSI